MSANDDWLDSEEFESTLIDIRGVPLWQIEQLNDSIQAFKQFIRENVGKINKEP